jgi:hypothetical protein
MSKLLNQLELIDEEISKDLKGNEWKVALYKDSNRIYWIIPFYKGKEIAAPLKMFGKEKALNYFKSLLE